MKYLEELASGDCFVYQDVMYFLTSDFRSSGSKLCYKMTDGSCRWLESNAIVEHKPLYILDTNNNFQPIKIHEKEQNV